MTSPDVPRAGVLLRHLADCTFDRSFGTDGVLTTTFRHDLSSVAVDGDHIYVAGRDHFGWVIARFGPTPPPATSTTATTTPTGGHVHVASPTAGADPAPSMWR